MIRTEDLLGGGLGVALATPFQPNGQLDEPALTRLVEHVVAGGADFVVALGSTGEAAMLTDAERERIIALVAASKGRARLVVGTGAPGTAPTCAWTRQAEALGADAALVAVPPYTKPTQAGIIAHFRAICDVSTLPLIAYNVPSRTGVNLTAETTAELWRLPNVVALKDSSGDLAQLARVAAQLPTNRALLAGDDALLLPTIAVGGSGVVSVAGNAVPGAMRELLDAARASDLERAQQLVHTLMPLFDALCLEPNPVPIKAALAILGIAEATPRLPLMTACDTTRKALKAALSRTRDLTLHDH